MRSPLEKLAEFQTKRTNVLVAMALILTVLLSFGIPKITLQTDFQESLPDDLAPIKTKEKINNRFSNTDSIIVLFQVNDEAKKESYVTDVRDPRFIRSLQFLSRELEREEIVASTSSLASVFPKVPESKQAVKRRLEEVNKPGLTNRDYTASTMYVKLSEESTEESVIEATKVLQENIDETPMYPGVDVSITGMPVIRTDLSGLLISDSKFTLALASVLILTLLVITRGLRYGPITFIPLALGLTWTLGAVGFLGIPLTIATVTMGAMILALGVEYGSFITERIVEESGNRSVEDAVKTALPSTGKAIMGSSTTTIIGFAALLLASISLMRDLGKTLALGIFLTQTAAVCVTPALIIKYMRWKGC